MADPDPQRVENLLIAVEHVLRQAELGNAVAHDAADLGVLVKDGDGHTHLRKPHCCDDARGTTTDDGSALAGGLGPLDAQALEVGA